MDVGVAYKVGRFFKTSYGGDGVDFVDQLNYQFTGGVLCIFIAIIGFRQYVGKPIQCWVPQEFTHSWEEYAENICWVSNTYYLLPTEDVPVEENEMEKVKFISYYQWVAIVFAGQAMLAWLPHLVWKVGSNRFPLLLRDAKKAAVPMRDLRQKAINSLVSTVDELAENQSRYRRKEGILRKCFSGPPPNMRFTLLFFFVRILYMGNSVGQIFLMQRFIGFKDHFFGYEVLRDLIYKTDLEISNTFPRVTYCNVKIKKMGQIVPASYTIQCVLPINYFIEKVYVFLWFWFVILSVLTFLSTCHWFINIALACSRLRFSTQYLKALREISNTEHRDCHSFTERLLGCDGVFLLMTVSHAASDLITLDVISRLWTDYKQARLSGNEDDPNRYLQNMKRGSRTSVLV